MNNHELRDLIHPIRIPTPFLVGDVYAYLINDDKKVLIDCGPHSDESLSVVHHGLDGAGLTIADIDEIWLTHGHPDHFGQAALIRDISGAQILGHPKERNNFGNNDDAERFHAFFRKHGITAELAGMMEQQLNWLQKWQIWMEPNQWIEQGESLQSGSFSFSVHHLPGHAPGHLAFREDSSGIIFGGDVLLDHISTNAVINFDPDTGKRNRSLLQLRESLRWMCEQEGECYPGHGIQIANPAEVAQKHLNDQEVRYRHVCKVLEQKPASLFELTQQMFPQILKPEQTFLTLSEVMGYLDWGIEEGVITEDQQEGHPVYSIN